MLGKVECATTPRHIVKESGLSMVKWVIVHWTLVLVLFFLCEKNKCSDIYCFLDLLIVLFSQLLLCYKSFCRLLSLQYMVLVVLHIINFRLERVGSLDVLGVLI